MGLSICSNAQETTQQSYYQNTILFLDANESKLEHQKLSKKFKVIKKQTLYDCIKWIRQSQIFGQILVICSGSLAQSLLGQLKNLKEQQNVKAIFIFCMEVQKYKNLISHKKVMCVENDTLNLIKTIQSNLSALQLPHLIKLGDSAEKVPELKYSYFLEFLTRPIVEKKERAILIQNFEETIMKYFKLINKPKEFHYPKTIDFDQMIKLYTTNQIYCYENNVIKSNILHAIKYSHIFIADLHQAIHSLSTFQNRCQIPQILYRGGMLKQSEIQYLSKLENSEIQFLSFLSTTHDQNVATQKQIMKNVLFTIYIPQFFRNTESKNLKIRGGYAVGQKEIVFNIRTIMTVFKLYTFNKITNVELIYGMDQIITHLHETNNIFQIHKIEPQSFQSLCIKCNSKIHLMSTVSKQIFCLNQIKMGILLKQSFIVINNIRSVIGIVLKYSEQVQKHISLFREIAKNSKICQKCNAKAKCSDCTRQFCLCTLPNHNPEHLLNSHIIVEHQLPRFISIEGNLDKLFLYQNRTRIEQNIYCQADSLITVNQDKIMNKATELYNTQIKSSEFQKQNYKKRYHSYFYRGQSRLKKKCIPNYTLYDEQLRQSLRDFEKCNEITQQNKDDIYLKSKALLHIGITLNELKQFEKVLIKCKQAISLLQSLQKKRALTSEELTLKIQVLKCEGQYYMHAKQYQMGANTFRNIIKSLISLKIFKKEAKAQYLNNLTFCLNKIEIFQEAVQTGKQSYELRVGIFGENDSLTKDSLNNFTKAKNGLSQSQKKNKLNQSQK